MTSRVPHRPRPLPPPSRCRRARHPRSERRRRSRTRPVRQLPRQLGLVAMRCPRPQHDPLDRDRRLGPRRQSTHRRTHSAHPTARDPKSDRQPQWTPHTSDADQLAMGERVHDRTRSATRSSTGDRLTTSQRSGAPHTTPSADIPTRKTLYFDASTTTCPGSTTSDQPTRTTDTSTSRSRSVDRGLGRTAHCLAGASSRYLAYRRRTTWSKGQDGVRALALRRIRAAALREPRDDEIQRVEQQSNAFAT